MLLPLMIQKALDLSKYFFSDLNLFSKLQRRLGLVVVVLTTALLTHEAQSADITTYPNQPIKIVVPFGPGGSADIMARNFGLYLESRSKQSVIIENRPGANGILGTEYVKNAAADGYTLLLTTNTTVAANLSLYKKVPYDPVKDFKNIGSFGTSASVVLVTKESKIDTIADLVKFSKSSPGQFFFGFYNASSQITAELFKLKTGANLTGIPYKSISNAIQDFYGNQIQIIFMEYLPAMAQIQGGKVKALAVTDASRYSAWPNVPTIAETYPGYELGFFLGLGAPVNISKEVSSYLENTMSDANKDPQFIAKLNQIGMEPSKITSTHYPAFVNKEIQSWGNIIKRAGIIPE
jgi:tripartite-type tricarboxylate transporter receptor subunit TctC